MDPKLLRRFWFPIEGHLGIGCTAVTRPEAEQLAREVAAAHHWPFEPAACIEDVDVRTLDKGHIIPNMGVVTWRGVWFPNLQHA